MLAESNNPFDLVRDGSSAADNGKTALRLLVIDDDSLHRMVICRAAAKAGICRPARQPTMKPPR
jgi:hypothetical protein